MQYRTDANLVARQSIYAYQRPVLDLRSAVLDAASLTGSETVTDVGCGNGLYLAELERRGHSGAVVGVDVSPGMLQSARRRAPHAALLAGDAASLPLRDGVGDLTLAMHMLYHVAAPEAAAREFRRITRPGGRVLVGLNGEDHLRELRGLIAEGLAEIAGHAGLPTHGQLHFDTGLPTREQLRLGQGETLLARVFASVVRHDFVGELMLPSPQPVADYVRSMIVSQNVPEPDRLVAAVTSRFPRDGMFRVRTHSGCLVCAGLTR